MRTTLTLDDPLAKALKNAAHQSGKSFKQVVNETLRAGLKAGKAPAQIKQVYRLKPAALGGPLASVDLDRALRIADALADEELHRKLEQRK